MLLLVQHALIELGLHLTVLASSCLKLLSRLSCLLLDDAQDVLQVVQQDLLLLLALGRLVEVIDLTEVVELLAEVLLRVLRRVEETEVLAVLL